MPPDENQNPESTEDLLPIDDPEAGSEEGDGAAGAASEGAGTARGVSQTQFEALQAQLGHLQQSNLLLQQAYTQSQQQAPQQTAPTRISDDQIQKLIDDGKGVEAMRLLAAEQANERVSQVERAGIGSLQTLTRQVATQSLPHYEAYKEEIEGYLQQVQATAPDALLNPDVYKLAHNYVVGQHVDDIVKVKVEQELRRRGAGVGVGDLTNTAGRTTTNAGGKMVATPEQLFGPEIVQTLQQKGGADNWAVGMGYKNWADYVTKTETEGFDA